MEAIIYIVIQAVLLFLAFTTGHKMGKTTGYYNRIREEIEDKDGQIGWR